jgi:hypothetical protein
MSQPDFTVPSHPLQPAMLFAYLANQDDLPGLSLYTDEPTDDGIHDIGSGGSVAPARVIVYPFADGTSKAFVMQVVGWRPVIRIENFPQIWMPELLAEFAVVTGAVQGPDWPNTSPCPLIPSNLDFMASAIAVTDGSIGRSGEIMLGSGSPAAVILETRGCKKIQFGFARVNEPGTFNALWARI